MRVCIAGSRSIREMSLLKAAIDRSGFEITEVLTGDADGVDLLTRMWARANSIPLKVYEAEWDNFALPWVSVRERKMDGKQYNAAAGMWRSKVMIKDADALILLWDGKSSGSKATLKYAQEKGIPRVIFRPNPESSNGLGLLAGPSWTNWENR